jgi:hypothetical protein
VGGLVDVGQGGQPGRGEQPLRRAALRHQAHVYPIDQFLRREQAQHQRVNRRDLDESEATDLRNDFCSNNSDLGFRVQGSATCFWVRRSRQSSLSAATSSCTRFTRATSFAGFACNRRRRSRQPRAGRSVREEGENTDMVGVGGAELEVEAALHVGEGGAGIGERGQDVVHRRVVPRPPPARIRHLNVFFLPAARRLILNRNGGQRERRLQWSVPARDMAQSSVPAHGTVFRHAPFPQFFLKESISTNFEQVYSSLRN